jgi:hypothetical protein
VERVGADPFIRPPPKNILTVYMYCTEKVEKFGVAKYGIILPNNFFTLITKITHLAKLILTAMLQGDL